MLAGYGQSGLGAYVEVFLIPMRKVTTGEFNRPTPSVLQVHPQQPRHISVILSVWKVPLNVSHRLVRQSLAR